jgi:hypothetical protein
MSWNGEYLSKPVSIGDVKNALGSSSNDLATLCTSPAINRWSKYKPIHHSGRGPLTNAEFAEDLGGQSGYRIKYGIKRANGYSMSDLVVSGVIQNRPWEYVGPSGGASSPYRLTDFVSCEAGTPYGYSVLGVCPIAMRMSATDGYLPIPTLSNDGVDLQFYFLFGPAVNSNGKVWLPEHSIAYTDLFADSELDYYPTILLLYKKNTLTGYYCKSSDQSVRTIASSGGYVGRVEINTKQLRDIMNTQTSWWREGEEWSVVFFLSQYKVLGTSTNHDLPTGRITRLQYEGTQVLGSPDFRLLKVINTTWVDDMNALSFTATMKPRSGYTGHYNVQGITVTYDTRVNRTIHVKVTYYVPGVNNSGQRVGYMSNANGPTEIIYVNGIKYETVLSHTIELDIPMVNHGSITFNIGSTYHVEDPDFVFIGSFPNNAQPASVELEFSYGGYAISRNVNIDCHDITTTKSSSATLIG